MSALHRAKSQNGCRSEGDTAARNEPPDQEQPRGRAVDDPRPAAPGAGHHRQRHHSRIEAIIAVHDLLYATDDGASADVGTLLRMDCDSPAVIPEERRIAVELDLAPGITLDARRATSTALIVTEILTNAVKHAFGAQPPRSSASRCVPRDGNRRNSGAGQRARNSGNLERQSGLALVKELSRDCRDDPDVFQRHRAAVHPADSLQDPMNDLPPEPPSASAN